MNELDVIQRIQEAKKFIGKPVAWPIDERIALLKRLKEVIGRNANDWSQQEAQQQGLPQSFVKEIGFEHVAYLIDQNISDLENFDSSQTILNPTGVLAVISAWPLSFRLVMESVVPALAAGNAVIVKPSSRSPITAKILEDLNKEAQIPQGALQVITGEGPKVGAFLAAHPGVRGVSFVGKTRTAESIIKATAHQFKKLRLRGSAKNSAVVLPGFDSSLLPELLNSFLIGQTGWSMTRLITTEAEAPSLIEKLKVALGDFKLSGDTATLSELRAKAIQEHGKPLSDRTDVPLFLLDLPNCSDFQQDELPAPVFPIVTVKYQHEIAKWLNNTSYGNLATIWGDQEKASKIAEKLEVGAIWLNHWMRPQDESPWGIKQSAFGIHENRATGSFFSDRKLTL